MADYGVIPTGFNRKPLDRILFELETAAQTIFGSNVVTEPESPMGQLLGLLALVATQHWELGEDVYQSYDPHQAEGVRLDVLAQMRILQRAGGEDDATFRQVITNQDRARNDIQDLSRAVRGLPGVTYSQVFVNDTQHIDSNNLPPGAVALAVLGGDDNEIAREARRFVVPGITTVGNVMASSVVDGWCRSINLVRPILVPVKLTVEIRRYKDALGCPPPSIVAIREAIVEGMEVGERRLLNGDDVTEFRIRTVVEARFPNVEVVSFFGERDGIVQGTNEPVTVGFIELATITLNDVTVTEVP